MNRKFTSYPATLIQTARMQGEFRWSHLEEGGFSAFPPYFAFDESQPIELFIAVRYGPEVSIPVRIYRQDPTRGEYLITPADESKKFADLLLPLFPLREKPPQRKSRL